LNPVENSKVVFYAYKSSQYGKPIYEARSGKRHHLWTIQNPNGWTCLGIAFYVSDYGNCPKMR
jgi:hypothetical protein